MTTPEGVNLTEYQTAMLDAILAGGTVRPRPGTETEQLDELASMGLISKRGGGWYVSPDTPERGRPFIGEPVTVRLEPDLLSMLDRWAATNAPSRADAIRTLLRERLEELAA